MTIDSYFATEVCSICKSSIPEGLGLGWFWGRGRCGQAGAVGSGRGGRPPAGLDMAFGGRLRFNCRRRRRPCPSASSFSLAPFLLRAPGECELVCGEAVRGVVCVMRRGMALLRSFMQTGSALSSSCALLCTVSCGFGYFTGL